jgi:Fe-Mn family superoxide dismutase
MKNLILAFGLLAASALPAAAASDTSAKAFTLPALPYATDALAPAIDAKTMEIHHGKHHQAYIDKLNAEVEKDSKLKGKSLGDIITSISSYGPAVRNNAGGHWNHSFFWGIMAPAAQSGTPSPELTTAINESFGSLDKFKTAFEKAGADRFGSGWVWLIVNANGKLEIVSTPNQDNPLMDDAVVKGTPILGNDVWEHAYYLTYQNKRVDYLNAW